MTGSVSWQQEFADLADVTLRHPLVVDVMAELRDNLGLSETGLPAYGIAKVAHYAAQVARAQALGIDPDRLRTGLDTLAQDPGAEVFRLHVAVRSGGASWGDWRYFEHRDELRIAVLEAHLDALAVGEQSRRGGLVTRLAARWRRDRPNDRHVHRVLAVERHTDAGWVPVTVHVIEPAVLLAPAVAR